MKFRDILRYVFFTKRCPCCMKVIYPFEEMCKDCAGKLKPINEICNWCGNRKDNCDCRYRNFVFAKVTAPFENSGSAKNGIYRLKFSGFLQAADYYSKQMAECIKRDFRDVNIDLITAVPMFKKQRKRRGYNQAEVLAKSLSSVLKIPTNFKLLEKTKKTLTQHSLSFEERAKNVVGAYSVGKPLCGETVLLVDDIKTTGFTLNECAKQLLLNGAKAVYCVTAVITNPK